MPTSEPRRLSRLRGGAFSLKTTQEYRRILRRATDDAGGTAQKRPLRSFALIFVDSLLDKRPPLPARQLGVNVIAFEIGMVHHKPGHVEDEFGNRIGVARVGELFGVGSDGLVMLPRDLHLFPEALRLELRKERYFL